MERYFSLIGIGEKPANFPNSICYFWDGNAVPEWELMAYFLDRGEMTTKEQVDAYNTQQDGRRFIITSNATMRDYCERMEELIPLWFDVL